MGTPLSESFKAETIKNGEAVMGAVGRFLETKGRITDVVSVPSGLVENLRRAYDDVESYVNQVKAD